MVSLLLSYGDNAKSVSVFTGDEIALRLPENSATGYQWHVERMDENIEQAGDSYSPDPNMRIGSGGVREFRFRVKAAGAGRLELKHWRAWEGESSVDQRFSIEVHSRPLRRE